MRRKRLYGLLFLFFLLCAEKYPVAQTGEYRYLFSTDTLALQRELNAAGLLEQRFPDSVQPVYTDLYRRSLAAGFRQGMMVCLIRLGNIALTGERYEQALTHFSFALRYCDTTNDRQRG